MNADNIGENTAHTQIERIYALHRMPSEQTTTATTKSP